MEDGRDVFTYETQKRAVVTTVRAAVVLESDDAREAGTVAADVVAGIATNPARLTFEITVDGGQSSDSAREADVDAAFNLATQGASLSTTSNELEPASVANNDGLYVSIHDLFRT